MDAPVEGERRFFGCFRLDPGGGRLFRRDATGDWEPVAIGSRALDVLRVLLRHEGAIVSKDTIMDAVWPGVAVEPNNLTVQIAALRRVLDAGSAGESCIRAVPGRGYRLALDVAQAVQAQPNQTAAWVAQDITALPEKRPPQPEPGSRTPLAPVRFSSIGAMVAGGVLLVAILASAGWWLLHSNASAPTVSAVAPTASRPVAYSPEDRRRSVIVLPFENSSGDPNQDSVAAGVTRDVTDRIAADHGVPLVPGATAAVYRGSTVDLRTLRRDHNVHFALTGNARRQDGRLFVSAVLYETDTDLTVWSQRFDRPDNSEELNHVVLQIAVDCSQATIDAEVARARREQPEHLDKRDLIFAALSTALSARSKQNYLARIALIERALAIDPDYIAALKEKAKLYAFLVADGFSSGPSADLSTALKAADRALQLAPTDVTALGRKARVLYWQGDLEGSATLLRKVIALDSYQEGWWYRELGQVQMAQGHYQEALENFITAKRLIPETSPFMQQNDSWVEQSVASGLLANDRFQEAIAAAKLALAERITPDTDRSTELPWLILIAAESEDGQDAQARADLQRYLATPRTFRTIADIQRSGLLDYATLRQLLDGLRRAGMSEE